MRLNLAMIYGLAIAIGLGSCCQPDLFAQSKTLAPGVLKIIPSNPQPRDSYSLPMQLPGLNATEWQPNYASKKHTLHGQTQHIIMYRDVWQYELGIIGLRQVRVEVPLKDGTKKGTNIWYMVYRIRNIGNGLTYEQKREDPRFEHIVHELKKDGKIKPEQRSFLPRFTLEGYVVKNNQHHKVSFRDSVNPNLLHLIQNREDPNLALLDTLGMNTTDVPISESAADDGVWGVAIWENVDPRIDFVSVFATGLTNAYRIVNKPDGSLGIKRRTLQMNFWRPGDSVYEITDRVDYGIPMVDNHRKQIEICRRYHLPGPVIEGFQVNNVTKRNVLVSETDAEFDLNSLKSEMIPQLDGGQLPSAVAASFAAAGYAVPNDATVKTIIAGLKWSFEADGQEYQLKLTPQYWEPKPNGGIRFIKSLDYLWIYR